MMPCPCCVFPGMVVRLDKKGKPFFQCKNCGTIIFPRLGEMGIQTVRHTLRLLENMDAASWVKTSAWQASQQPGNVLALIGAASPALSAPATPATSTAAPAGSLGVPATKEMSR